MERTTSPRRLAVARVVTAFAVAGALVLAGPAGPTTTSAKTKTIKATENASLKLSKKDGTMFRHRGKVTGTVSGPAYSRIRLKGLTLKGTVTVKSKHGKLRIRINGKARSGGRKPVFEGKAKMSGGTGRYRKARGNGRFKGVIDRSNWTARIRAVGSLRY